MRLKTSRVAAEESILNCLHQGYRLAQQIHQDYIAKCNAGEFNRDLHVAEYKSSLNDWIQQAIDTLEGVFPTSLEAHMFFSRFSVTSASYPGMDEEVAYIVYQRFPKYTERLYNIFSTHLPKYSDLPLENRLFIEDIDSFKYVRDVNPSVVSAYLNNGRVELTEDEVQMALEAILNETFHKKDWGGETNDLYTTNLIVNGVRRPTAFLLKGSGLKRPEMMIADCGKNGDQITRLFHSPAELFVVQFVGRVSEAIIEDLESKVVARRAQGKNANYLVIDGQDTARLLYAYGKLV